MAEKTYLVRFRSPNVIFQHVVASSYEIRGSHLVFLTEEGNLAAVFLKELVRSWNVLPD
jgi:hypothetical protein